MLLKLLNQSLLFLFRKGIEHEYRFVANVILESKEEISVYDVWFYIPWRLLDRDHQHQLRFYTLIGWVNFLPANITKSAIQEARRVSFTPLSIMPVCTFQVRPVRARWDSLRANYINITEGFNQKSRFCVTILEIHP